MKRKMLMAAALSAALIAGGPLVGTAGAQTSPPRAVDGAATPSGDGLWVAWSNGRVDNRAAAPHLGEITGPVNAPIVDITGSVQSGTVTGPGYYLAAADGGVFTFGSASFRGSAGNIRLNRPIVGMGADTDGVGYWLAASDGGVFTYQAPFYGSTGGMRLNRPIVGFAPSLSRAGYYLVAEDGGVFAFGAARFHGSTGGVRLNQPIVGMATDPDGAGYWLVAADGGVFSFDAAFHGSPVGRGWIGSNDRVVGIEAHPSGNGYFVITASGGAIGFGAASTVISPPS